AARAADRAPRRLGLRPLGSVDAADEPRHGRGRHLRRLSLPDLRPCRQRDDLHLHERGQGGLDRSGRDADRPGRAPPADDRALGSSVDDPGGSGVASVAYQISAAGADSWSGVSASWNTASTGDGLYDLRIVATDLAGNTGISAERTGVRVDNTPPAVTLASPG